MQVKIEVGKSLYHFKQKNNLSQNQNTEKILL